jgi:hypothetical protein
MVSEAVHKYYLFSVNVEDYSEPVVPTPMNWKNDFGVSG